MKSGSVASYPQVLSAFAGAGGLDLAVRIIAPNARTVAYIEREARSAVNLVARMEETALDEAPVWDQIETFDGQPWRGIVDWIIASPPCQPFSLAGKKRGDRDHRAFGEGAGPLAGFLRVIDEIRPAVVFLENVSAWITDGWFRSFGDVLAGMGYSIPQSVFFAAEDFGFPHKRERVFILAYTPSVRQHKPGKPGNMVQAATGKPEYEQEQNTDGVVDCSSELADADRSGAERDQSRDRAGCGAESDSPELADPDRQGLAQRERETAPDLQRTEQPGGTEMGNTHGERRRKTGGGGTPEEIRPAGTGAELAVPGSARLQGQRQGGPAPGAAGRSGRTDLPLFPPGSGIDDIPEWLEIFSGPDGWRYSPALPKSRIRGMVDGLAGRVDRLRLTGEGVVPVVAAVALAVLLRSADIGHELWQITGKGE